MSLVQMLTEEIDTPSASAIRRTGVPAARIRRASRNSCTSLASEWYEHTFDYRLMDGRIEAGWVNA
ncbi:MAG: hypothetical protein BroJett022_23360 [Actinomycetes bacterium]|nr:MAG: hypothetical protein BroJett022_23360 [Actinomycetes bacterium]